MECQQFSIKIKKICKSKGMTIKELLEKCGISRNFIYAIEKNNQIPSVDKVEKIADQLDCSVDYLLGRTDEQEIKFDYSNSIEIIIDGKKYRAYEER